MTKLRGTMILILALNLTSAVGLMAGQPAAKHDKKTLERPPAQEKQTVRTDRFGDLLPEGTIARLGTVQRRSASARVGLSPDGKTIVAVSGAKLVKFWDAETGKLRNQRELPVSVTHQFFLSPDGRLLAVQVPDGDTPIDIWDIATAKRLQRFQLPQRTGIYRAIFSPDGKTFAVGESGASRGAIRLWDVKSGEQRVLKGDGRPPEKLAFSPDGKLLATSGGQHITCWNIAKEEQLWQTKSGFNSSVAFTPDGRTVIASPGSRESAWRAWDAATGTPAEGLKLPEGFNYAELAVAPDGRTLVFAQTRAVQGADRLVRIWDMREGKLLRTLTGEGPIGPLFPDGKSILTNDGVLQRWELATGRPLLPVIDKVGHRLEVSDLVYSPDGRRLASVDRAGAICLWEVASSMPRYILRDPQWRAVGIAFTPDGKKLVSGGLESKLFIWDVETGKELLRIPLHDPERGEKKQHVSKLHVTPDARTILVLGYDPSSRRLPFLEHILTSFDSATGQRKTRANIESRDLYYSNFTLDGGTIVSGGELVDTVTGKTRIKLEGGPNPLSQCAITSDGRLAAGFIKRTVIEGTRISIHMDAIQICDAASGRALRGIPTDWVGEIAFSPDGRYLVAADLQGLRLWELATGQVICKHKSPEHLPASYAHSFASCLSFSPDGRTLATGHLDSTILIWDLVPSGRSATAEDLPRLWDDLIGTDAVRAYAASWRLVETPKEAIRFLKERLRPASPASAEQIRPLLADLDSDEFSKRQTAAARIQEMGHRAEKWLKEALEASPSLEKRRRLEELLNNLEKPPSGERLRHLRALAVLERIGTPEAQQVLKTLAQGIPEAPRTREAKASLERLASRPPAEKR